MTEESTTEENTTGTMIEAFDKAFQGRMQADEAGETTANPRSAFLETVDQFWADVMPYSHSAKPSFFEPEQNILVFMKDHTGGLFQTRRSEKPGVLESRMIPFPEGFVASLVSRAIYDSCVAKNEGETFQEHRDWLQSLGVGPMNQRISDFLLEFLDRASEGEEFFNRALAEVDTNGVPH